VYYPGRRSIKQTKMQSSRSIGQSAMQSSSSIGQSDMAASHTVTQPNMTSSTQTPTKKKRTFIRWSCSETQVILANFMPWIKESNAGLPGKKDILEFQAKNPSITVAWEKICNKVLNERMAYSKRKDALKAY
jgi:hypothetical protein